MANDLDELEWLTREIINPEKELKDLTPQAEGLRDFFEQQTQFYLDPAGDLATGETRLDSGLAISPTLAAMCIRELFRTTAFIRGLFAAIKDSLSSSSPVHVLYAGCGPYALLAVPLMTVFTPAQLRFTLLDVHQESLGRALALIESLGCSAFLDDALCLDASHYQIPVDRQPDIIVSETMAVCLRNEPQVSIARNLLGQAPEARMVPQSVSVAVCLLDPSKEFAFMPAGYTGPIPEPKRDRIHLGKIFELDAANIRAWRDIDEDCLPGGRVTMPTRQEKRYLPYLMTDIVVYGEDRLQNYDSSLTMPRTLEGNLVAGATLQFRYMLGAHPELVYEVTA